MKDSQKKKLNKIAIEMVLCKSMPSSYTEDHPKYVSRYGAKCGWKAEKQCKEWAYEIRKVIGGNCE